MPRESPARCRPVARILGFLLSSTVGQDQRHAGLAPAFVCPITASPHGAKTALLMETETFK